MKTKKPIYRFFAAFIMLAVLFSAILPATLTGKALAEEICSMFSDGQPMRMATEICPLQAQKKLPDKATAKEKPEPCKLTYADCCIVKTPVSPKAVPAFQNTSLKIVAFPVRTIGPIAYASPVVSTDEHIFLKASDSSPPIFLKNSSFLN